MVECSIGEWVLHSEYEKIKADLDYVRRMRTQETLDLQEMSNIVNEVRAENERLRFASKCDIPKLYSQINFVDKKWEVVRLGAKDDVEDNGEKCVRVTITIIETK